MRVLVIAPTPFFADRGCHVRILGEVQALQDLGHEIKLCTYHLGKDIGGIDTVRTPAIPWYQKLSAGPSIHKIYIDGFLLLKVLRVCKDFRPDVIHAHLHEGIVVGSVVSQLYSVPMLADLQGSLTEEILDHKFIPPWRWLVNTVRWIEGKVNDMPDHLIASSTPTAELVMKRFGVSASRISAIGDGVDLKVFCQQEKDIGLMKQLGIDPKDLVIVFIGVLTSYQGIDLLLEAMPAILEKISNAKVLCIGFPEESYREKAKQMGLEASVLFPGKIPYAEASRYLSLGHVAVSPKISTTEANLKLFGYMAMGLPTVVFDNPINREILGDLGIYAQAGDVLSLAEMLVLALNDEELRKRLGGKSHQKAVDCYSWKAVGEQLTGLYKQVISNKKN